MAIFINVERMAYTDNTHKSLYWTNAPLYLLLINSCLKLLKIVARPCPVFALPSIIHVKEVIV
jgi:hypothetical protein